MNSNPRFQNHFCYHNYIPLPSQLKGREGFIWLVAPGYILSLQGTYRYNNLRQLVTPYLPLRAEKEMFACLLLRFSYSLGFWGALGLENGANHNGLDFPISISNQENSLEIWPQANQIEALTPGCDKLTFKTIQCISPVGLHQFQDFKLLLLLFLNFKAGEW